MIALLAVNRDMAIAHFAKIGEREFIILHFGFLQAQNIRLGFAQKALHKADPQADGIDVPSADCEGQGQAPAKGLEPA